MPAKGQQSRKRGRVMANGKADLTRHKYIKPGTAEDGDRRLMQLKRDLIGMANDGYFDNWPDVKNRVLEGYNPLLELAAMSLTAPGESQRIIAAKIVSEFTFVPLAHSAEPVSANAITIHIEPYAQGRLVSAMEPPAPHRVGIPAIDVVGADRELPLHRNSAPTPEPAVAKYAEFEVINGDARPVVTSESKNAATADETIDSFGTTVRIRGTSNG
jgi:hypothetical protein